MHEIAIVVLRLTQRTAHNEIIIVIPDCVLFKEIIYFEVLICVNLKAPC